MTEKEQKWLEYYLESGQAQDAVKYAFPDCKTSSSIVTRASQLKTKLANEIDSRLMSGYKMGAPQAVRIIRDLMTSATQEAVKLKAAQDWLSRAGHDAAFKVEHSEKPASHEELKQRLLSAMSELEPDEIKPIVQLLAKNGQVDEIQALMTLTTENPQ